MKVKSHSHAVKRATALALALGAVAPTAACARVALDPPASQTTRANVYVPAASAFTNTVTGTRANVYVPPASAFTDTVAPGARAPKAQAIRVSNGTGFDWADAGIGAAGGVGIAMLGVAGALAIAGVRRGDRRPLQPRWSDSRRGLS